MSRTKDAARLAMRRRSGASEEASERVQRSLQQADDLHSQCRFCGHRRFGTWEQVTGKCPGCGAG